MVKPHVQEIAVVPAPHTIMRSFAKPRLRHAVLLLSFAAVILTPAIASSQLRRNAPTSLTDAEFWDFFTSMSETGGSFPSENFVSNEMTFQHVIPVLQRTVTKDGVYLGVGPEQNFTYIANLKPRMAVIFDIRRQNAMAHLMYKAMFELSPTRGEFVSRLFSRPLAARVAASAKVGDLFAVALAAARSDSAYSANQKAVFATLVNKHHFALTPGDSAMIEHLLEVFYEAGPEVDYGYRLGQGSGRFTNYPSFAALQSTTNADSVPMAFLGTEENYQTLRAMHQRNLIVPVVGDFAGPKAIRSVGDYLKQRSMTVAAFYLSNVEQYLFQNGVASRFYENVGALPIDSGSTFIRSVPPGGGMGGSFTIVRSSGTATIGGANGTIIRNGSISTFGGSTTSVSVIDTGGYREIRITQDSGGRTLTRMYRDSGGALIPQGTASFPTPQDSLMIQLLARRDSLTTRYMMPNLVPLRSSVASGVPSRVAGGGPILASGISQIRKTLDAYSAGTIRNYPDIIAMTKLDNWK